MSCSNEPRSPTRGGPSAGTRSVSSRPNWMTRLPGHRYLGADPDGYMTASEVIGLLDGVRPAPRGAGPHRYAGPARDDRSRRHVHRGDRRRIVAVPRRRGRHRGVQHTEDPHPRRRPARAPPAARADPLPAPRGRSRRPCPRRRGVGVRSPAGRGARRGRPGGDARRRCPHSAASDLPRLRHPPLDGRPRRAGRAVRRGGGHRQGPPAAVAATHRLTRSPDARSERAHVARRRAAWAGWSPRPTGGPTARAHSPISAPTPISRWVDCWTRSTRSPTPPDFRRTRDRHPPSWPSRAR